MQAKVTLGVRSSGPIAVVDSAEKPRLGMCMRWTASLCIWLALVPFAAPVPQLGAPLGRCGPHPPDPDWLRKYHARTHGVSADPEGVPLDMDKLRHNAKELAELSASHSCRRRPSEPWIVAERCIGETQASGKALQTAAQSPDPITIENLALPYHCRVCKPAPAAFASPKSKTDILPSVTISSPVAFAALCGAVGRSTSM
jgi:hypothetical protein